MNKSKILYLFTRTPLHVGSGASVGAIDQPIIRERHTGFPIIPGASLKGVLADAVGETSDPKKERTPNGREIFGSTKSEEGQGYAGGVSFGEGKIFFFPVRSATGCFAWVTCPLILARWKTADGTTNAEIPECAGNSYYGDSQTLAANAVFEDLLLACAGPLPETWKQIAESVIGRLEPAWKAAVAKHLALVSDDVFAHLVVTCCEVPQHIRLDDSTGVVARGALFNQENVPSETVFFAIITELRANTLAKLSPPKVIQIGADATTGLGFCSAVF